MASKRQQPQITRLSEFERRPSVSVRAKKRRRAKQIYIPLFVSNGFLITLRSFKTKKQNRSKRYKQLVIHPFLLPVKEISIRIGRPDKLPRRASWREKLVTAAIILLIISGIGGSIYFGLQMKKPSRIDLAQNRLPAPTLNQSKNTASTKTVPASQPLRLHIDKISLDADVTTIGRNTDGTIEVPTDYHVTGWYKYGPTPGELGPSVIVGHVDNVHGIAVFWRLRELVPGDIIQVGRADGKTVSFKVTQIKQVPKDNFPTQEVYGNLNYAGIRLITCGGVFNPQTHEYDLNTVVFGSLII